LRPPYSADLFEEGTVGYAVGIVLALVVSCFARLTGFDRDRAFYPTVAVVVASYYVLFAVMGGSMRAVVLETVVMIVFTVCAVTGLRYSPWLTVAGLAAHGLFDFVHAHLIDNPGVPQWWPAFCGAYDVVAAACLAWLSRDRKA
jgi:hypothetical protein